MNKISVPGFSAGAPCRTSRFLHDLSRCGGGNAWSILTRFTTIFAWLCASTLLPCMFSTRANAALSVDGALPSMRVDAPLPAEALAAHDAQPHPGQTALAHLSHEEVAAGTPLVLASRNSDSGNASPSQLEWTEHATSVGKRTWQLTLAALAFAVLAGVCLSRAALTRIAKNNKRIVSEWARRCEAIEARERTTRAVASQQASADLMRERHRFLGVVRFYIEAPLSAVADLFEPLQVVTKPSAQSAQLQAIQSAMRIWRQTLRDLFDNSPLESRALVLDESATNVREFIKSVITLLTPSATHQGVRLSASVDQTVAAVIIVDGTRLGQILFHLLNRAIQSGMHKEIALVVRADSLNLGSQRIFFSIRVGGGKLGGTDADESRASEGFGDADASLPLCRLLAQRMRGELSVASGVDAGVFASFNAPFAVEQWESEREADGNTPLPATCNAVHADAASTVASHEPFERRYLTALSEEGVDLPSFLDGWRRAMNDDLARLATLRRPEDDEHLPALLHRLSGAVGLVGARGLMEALRRASASPQERNAGAIDALAERTRTLVMQLGAAHDPQRSTVR